MFRRARFAKLGLRYDERIGRAQDYELWTRASAVQFANLGLVLALYRIHAGQVGKTEADKQRSVADTVRVRQMARLRLQASQREVQLHHNISLWQFPKTIRGLKEMHAWLLKLQTHNLARRIYDPFSLNQVLERRWWAACRSRFALGLEAWKLYQSSSLAGGRRIGERAEFWAKAASRQL
jgi:hypothetical protein